MNTLLLTALALAAPVSFQLNDAVVKDKALAGVEIRVSATAEVGELVGVTDGAGKLATDLSAGTHYVSYRHDGYVPIAASPIEVPEGGALITTTLSMLLEAQGLSDRRRVQIVLNWGSEWSDVPDADAHLICTDGAEVYFADKRHTPKGHEVSLDVDDTDWGGPETITLLDPPPGRYRYFVQNYTGKQFKLGQSEVVVRLLIGDAVAGEYRVPEDVTARRWFPFDALVVDEGGAAHIEPFTAEELAAGADRATPTIWLGCVGLVSWLGAGLGFGLVFLWVLTRLRR